MLGEQRNWDFAPDKGVPGIHYRGADGKLQWRELTAARKRAMEAQGFDVDAIIKDWKRRYEQKTGKPYVKPRPSSVSSGSFNVTPKGTDEREKLDAKIQREIEANAEAEAPEPRQPIEQRQQRQQRQPQKVIDKEPLNKDGTLPTRIGLNVKGDTPMQQWAKNFPELAKRVLKKKTPQAGYGEIKKIKSQLGEQMDTFDIIKEYLLSEGYATSEGAAHAIMTSMSEEWKQSILENIMGGPLLPKEKGRPVYPPDKQPKKHPQGGVKLPKV